MSWCEANGIYYWLGLAKNAVLLRKIAPKLGKLRHDHARGEVEASNKEVYRIHLLPRSGSWK